MWLLQCSQNVVAESWIGFQGDQSWWGKREREIYGKFSLFKNFTSEILWWRKYWWIYWSRKSESRRLKMNKLYEFEQEMLNHVHNLKNEIRENGWIQRETPEVSHTSFLRSEESDAELGFKFEWERYTKFSDCPIQSSSNISSNTMRFPSPKSVLFMQFSKSHRIVLYWIVLSVILKRFCKLWFQFFWEWNFLKN